MQELYKWIDSVQLSRPKRNISRDFSDGVLVAEVDQSPNLPPLFISHRCPAFHPSFAHLPPSFPPSLPSSLPPSLPPSLGRQKLCPALGRATQLPARELAEAEA